MYPSYLWKKEDEVLKNAKEHVIKEHGYTEESWNEEISTNLEHFKKIINICLIL